MAAAWEIARELSLAGAEDEHEAALFGGQGSPTPLPLNSHRTWRAWPCAFWRRLVVSPGVGVCLLGTVVSTHCHSLQSAVRIRCGHVCGGKDLQAHREALAASGAYPARVALLSKVTCVPSTYHRD